MVGDTPLLDAIHYTHICRDSIPQPQVVREADVNQGCATLPLLDVIRTVISFYDNQEKSNINRPKYTFTIFATIILKGSSPRGRRCSEGTVPIHIAAIKTARNIPIRFFISLFLSLHLLSAALRRLLSRRRQFQFMFVMRLL
jgi:hypothetical protein